MGDFDPITLDPNDLVPLEHGAKHLRQQAEILRALTRENADLDPDLWGFIRYIADLMEPPRIPEPSHWGVVEAHTASEHEPTFYVRTAKASGADWTDVNCGDCWAWDDLIDPVLIREGVQ